MDSFKYKTSFAAKIFSAQSESFAKLFSNGSLEKLRPLIPKDIDLDKNVDLLAVAFNAAVVNKFNRNGDGIDSATAIGLKDYFIHKPTNIEHNKNKVVGHVVNASFSNFLTNDLIENEEDLLNSTDPFNIALSSVIYKMVNPAFAELIEKSADESDEFGGIVSASWELGFTDYEIAIGSSDLRDAEIIKGSRKEEFDKYLKANGGEGIMDDGTPVHRLVVGEIFPLGIGFTSNPAAEVEGIYVEDSEKKEAITKKNISQKEKTNVIESTQPNIIMEKVLEKLNEFLESSNSSKKFSEEIIANMSKVVHDAIMEKNEEWKHDQEKSDTEKKDLLEAAEEQEKKISDIESKLGATAEELESVKSELLARDAAELFNSRMEQVEENYELDVEDSKFLAQEVKVLASDESDFEEYKNKLSVIWRHKSKEFKEEQDKLFQERVEAEIEKRISESSDKVVAEDEVVQEAVENAEEAQEAIANNNDLASQEPETLIEKFQKAFSEEDLVEVQY